MNNFHAQNNIFVGSHIVRLFIRFKRLRNEIQSFNQLVFLHLVLLSVEFGDTYDSFQFWYRVILYFHDMLVKNSKLHYLESESAANVFVFGFFKAIKYRPA